VKNLVLIGASGFVGTRFIDLTGTANCINIDKTPSEKYNDHTVIHDIRNVKLEEHFPDGADTVVLLAAEHRDDVIPVSLYFDVNVIGTQNVLDAMDCRGIKKIIFTSSAAVYGLGKDNPDENFPKDPFSYYGKSKWQAEQLLQKWYEKDPENRSLTIIRSAVIFGENNKGNVHNLLRQIASGRFLMIGKGNNKKSMVYVGNAAAFLKYCVETAANGCRIFNYVDTPDLTMNELIIQVEKSLGKKLPSFRLPYWIGMLGGYGFDLLAFTTRRKFAITSVRIKKFCATTQFSAATAHNTGFKAPFSLSEGLDRTLKSEFGESK
jgi:nucleoside-diphosphate-sugar epimerase